jgi:membrane dipeptidase
VVVDAHTDVVVQVARGGRRFEERSSQGHVDLPRLREGGVDVQVFALWVEPEYKPERALPRLLHLLDAFHGIVEASAGAVVPCASVQEIDRAVAAGRLAAVLSVEGAEPVGRDLALLRVLHRVGVRVLGLVWNERNAIGDGVGEERAGGGLTEFGAAVVREMNRLGMVIDVSHLNERGFWDVMEISAQPVVASHSNARALCDHPRNLRDEQIRALAAAGGVVGINFYPRFVDPARPTLARVVDHIDHVASLVGPDHVGLGSDFDGIESVPEGLEDATRFPAVTEELLRRGYREDDVRKILGGNFLRVFRQVWGA